MADYSNLILIYEEIINELSDELVNRVRQKRKENAEKAWQEMCRQHGEGKSINQMLLAAAKDRANELLCKQRNERKKGIKHDPEDTEDLQVQYKEIKRNNDILKENREKDVRKDLFVAYQRVFDTAGELQKQLDKNNEEIKSFKGKYPTDEFSVKRLNKEGEKTVEKAQNAFSAKKKAEATQNLFNQVSDKSQKEGKVIPFKHESLLDVLESLEFLISEMNTGISGMMDTQPNPVVGGPVNITKQKKGKQKRGQLGYKYLKIRTASMK